MKDKHNSVAIGLIASMLVLTAVSPSLIAADERTQAFLEPNPGPHGELRFGGKVEVIGLKTHTISVEHKAEVRPFVVGDQTKLLTSQGQALRMKDFKKGETVNVLYVASKGVWKAHEIRQTESSKNNQAAEAAADKKAKK